MESGVRIGAGSWGWYGSRKGSEYTGRGGVGRGCRRILVWWCHAGKWYLSLSLSLFLSLLLLLSWCVSVAMLRMVVVVVCSTEENGKKGRWMEWRLGMIRRRTDWVAGFAR